MNKLFFLMAVWMVVFSCNKQEHPSPKVSEKYSEEEVTEMVQQKEIYDSRDVIPTQRLKEKLNNDFPNATDISWDKTRNNLYEADFDIKGVDYEALYDEKGNLIKYTRDVSIKEFGDVMKNAVLTKYPDFRIDGVKKIVVGSKVMYKIDLESKRIGNEMELSVLYSEDGKFIKETVDY